MCPSRLCPFMLLPTREPIDNGDPDQTAQRSLLGVSNLAQLPDHRLVEAHAHDLPRTLFTWTNACSHSGNTWNEAGISGNSP